MVYSSISAGNLVTFTSCTFDKTFLASSIDSSYIGAPFEELILSRNFCVIRLLFLHRWKRQMRPATCLYQRRRY